MKRPPTTGKILLFGGTFDPPHVAHSHLPALAAAQLGCDRIIYIPAAINPLKAATPPTAKEHRLAMLVLALEDVPNAAISSIELERAGPSYTIDTLRALKKALAGPGDRQESKGQATDFHLLIGVDQALEFHRWKEWEQILKLATPAVMLRPPWTRESFAKELAAAYGPQEAARWLSWTLEKGLPQMEVSATDLRGRLQRGEPVDGQLSPAVAAYIRANGLYSADAAKSR